MITKTQRKVLEAAARDRVALSPTEQVWRITGGPVVRPATIERLRLAGLAVPFRGRLVLLAAGRRVLGIEVADALA